MKARIAAISAALILAVAAPVSSAMAFTDLSPADRYEQTSPYGRIGVGSHDGPLFQRCPMSSASEGNANQQNFPVKQYGQTSGGYRC